MRTVGQSKWKRLECQCHGLFRGMMHNINNIAYNNIFMQCERGGGSRGKPQLAIVASVCELYHVVPDESTQKDCICVDSSWEKIQTLPAAHIDLHLQTQMCSTVSHNNSSLLQKITKKCCFLSQHRTKTGLIDSVKLHALMTVFCSEHGASL